MPKCSIQLTLARQKYKAFNKSILHSPGWDATVIDIVTSPELDSALWRGLVTVTVKCCAQELSAVTLARA